MLAPLALVAAACGGGHHAGTTTAAVTTAARAAAGKTLRVAIVGQDHHPRVNAKWHYSVHVTDAAGKPVPCRIHLEFLFSGQPVGQVGVHRVANGVWQETFGAPGNPPFPPASRGQSLVLEAIVTAKGYKQARAGWSVTPR